MEKTKVVHVNRDEYDIYIGRASQFKKLKSSIFGNPFSLKDYSREQAIEKYREWFNIRLEEPEFKAEVMKLKGKRLACWCKPKACHGDVIAEYLNNDS